MTNALVQNIEIDKNNAIDTFLQGVNLAPNQNEVENNQKFSNFMNNLDARFNKAQNNFDKQAQVSNTSSINKKALIKKETTLKQDIKTQTTTTQNKEIKQTSSNNSENVSVKNTVQNKQNSTAEVDSKEIKNENEVISKEIKIEKDEPKEDLSDINNSSPVESSPVFSFEKDENIEQTKTEIESALEKVQTSLDEFVQTIPVAINVSNDDNQEIELNLEDLINNLEVSDEPTKVIEQISNYLDDSSLNQEQKETILNVLNQIKDKLNNTQEISFESSEFSELVSNLADEVNKLFSDETEIEIDAKPINKEETSEIDIEKDSKIAENNKNETEIETSKEIKNETKDLINEVKDFIKSIDSKDLAQTFEKLPEIIEKTDDLIENVKDIEIKSNDDLVDMLKNLKDVLKSAFEDDKKITLENVDLKDFKDVEVTDKKSMDELLNLLDNINSNNQLDDETKIQIEDLIKKISENTISQQELTTTLNDITSEIQVDDKKTETNVEVNNEVFEVELKSSDRLVLDDNTKQNNSDSKNFKQTYENDFKLNETSEFDFDNEIQLKTSNNQKIELDNVEDNLQKTIAIQDMLDEMMIEVDIKTIPTQSGALSVSDEVAKLAMGESNSLNPITSAHGSVTYDSIGTNAVIKNVATLMKSAQTQTPSETPSMEDLLNQVTNKITQLKDGANQKLTMILRPNDLGRLSIELTQDKNGLTTQIMAQNDNVRAYIEKNIDSLRQQLADSGVSVNSIQIKTAGQEGSTQYDGNQNLANQQEDLAQQNNKQNQNQEQKNDNKEAKEVLASMTNYEMSFKKDFSSVLNNTLNYSLN